MKISIITATWNCLETVSDCLSSVAHQSYKNYEHIVVDGKSTDGTIEILEGHRDKLAVFISEPDSGIYDALNKGILHSSGDIIGFLHADDVYAEVDILERIADKFKDPNISAVYGDLQYVKRNDLSHVVRNWKSSKYNQKNLKRGWMPPHPTLYVRRDWYFRINGFDTRYKISADYHSILRLFSYNDFSSAYIPDVLVKMRLGGVSNRSIKNIFLKSSEDLDALKRSNVGGLATLIRKNLSKIFQLW